MGALRYRDGFAQPCAPFSVLTVPAQPYQTGETEKNDMPAAGRLHAKGAVLVVVP